MRVHRRTFVGLTSAIVAKGILPEQAWSSDAQFKPLVVILSDCDPNLDREVLFSFIDPIISHKIAIGIATGPDYNGSEPGRAIPDNVGLIRKLAEDFPGLVEALPQTDTLQDPLDFFQARHSFEIRNRFLEAFNPVPRMHPVSLFSTVEGVKETGAAGIRASGFRTIFSRKDNDNETTITYLGDGVLRVAGGIFADATLLIDDFRKQLDQAVHSNDAVFVNLSLAKLAGASPAQAFDQGAELAVAIARRKALGQVVSNLPRDFHLRSLGTDYDRAITVCIEMPVFDPQANSIFKAFQTELDALPYKFPISILSRQSDMASATDPQAETVVAGEFCPVLDARDGSGNPRILVLGNERLSCAANSSDAPENNQQYDDIGLSALVDLSGTGRGARGLDKNGILRLPVTVKLPQSPTSSIDGKLPGMIGSHNDAIIVVDIDVLAKSSERNLVVRELASLAAQPWSKLSTLRDYAKSVEPSSRHLDLVRQARFDSYVEVERHSDTLAPDAATLKDYAELAWLFFAKYSHDRSGFTPSTVFRTDGYSSNYEVITMWDISSHLNGILCAAELGIIQRAEMIERIEKILKSIPARKIAGLRLPISEFHFATANPVSTDFNSCDVGRLLVTLHLLSGVAELSDKVQELVAGWDLSGTIRDNKLMDIRYGRFRDASINNCSSYASAGYRLWGVDVPSPVQTPDDESTVERGMRVLHAVSNIGPFGAEPLLLEELELGFSPQSRILADVLYSAQLAEFHNNGTLIAVSETPLDREPWFIYQGFDLDDPVDPWKVRTLTNEAKYRTPGFVHANRMLGTKAAFMWSQIRTSPFTDAMLARATKDTQLKDLGFAVGIYQSTDQPTFGYSGMNTNGVILEAIAYALRGKKPMTEAML